MNSQTGKLIAIGALAGVAALLASKAGEKAAAPAESDKPTVVPPPPSPEGDAAVGQFGAAKKTKKEFSNLSISPDCSRIFEGEDWLERCALPAIDRWIQEGYGRNPWYGWSEITRGILSPYNKNLESLVPWADLVYQYAPAPPDLYQMKSELERKMMTTAFNTAMNAFNQAYTERSNQFKRMYPQLAELIQKLDNAVYQRMSGNI